MIVQRNVHKNRARLTPSGDIYIENSVFRFDLARASYPLDGTHVKREIATPDISFGRFLRHIFSFVSHSRRATRSLKWQDDWLSK